MATDAVANPTAALSEGEALLLDYISPEYATSLDPASIANLPLPQAVEISYYTVKRGDAISTIARRFGRSADSILSLNGIKNAKSLKIGTELKIPNMDGLLHVVAKGESLGSIARRYKVELTLLADANDLGSMTLKVGQSLFIPGARLSADELRRIYGSTFAWPVRGPHQFLVRGTRGSLHRRQALPCGYRHRREPRYAGEGLCGRLSWRTPATTPITATTSS